jgi:hypothetical protein
VTGRARQRHGRDGVVNPVLDGLDRRQLCRRFALVNRSGNRPSHEQADVYLDKAADLCRQSGFRKITMRGDTDFTQTTHLDRWDDAKDVRFIFGFDAHPSDRRACGCLNSPTDESVEFVGV